MRALTPPTIAPPLARYSHAVEVPSGCRLIVTSGQLGQRADGSVPEDAGEQARICLENIDAILRSAGADRSSVVRINAYVTDRAHMPAYMAARDEWLEGQVVRPASTLMIVSGFTRPEFKVEIEVLAAVPAD